MFKTDLTAQRQLFAFTVRDLVADDSDVWLYIDIFDHLDLEEFDWSYSNEGQHPIEPKLMLRSIFYGLTHGVVSGHRLETSCRNDNRFIVLSGDLRPNRRTFDRFIRRHHERIESLFVASVKMAQEMGLVKLGRVALDGSRFKGNTSRHREMKYPKMARAVCHIKEELAKLREDLAAQAAHDQHRDDKLDKEIKNREKRIERILKAKEQIELEHELKSTRRKRDEAVQKASKSLNDSEALSLDSRGNTFIFGYNAQAAVDAESQIVVAADIHASATDYQALPKLLDQVKENCGSSPESVLADLGYKSYDNMLAVEAHGANSYIAMANMKTANADIEFYEQVTPTENEHKYRCLAGKIIPLNSGRPDGSTDFQLSEKFCKDCPFATSCKGFGRKTIKIPKENQRLAAVRLLQRSRTDEFKEVYKYRKAIVEPVFGNIKNKGVKIAVTGKTNVGVWWKLVCTAHNLEKIAKSWGRSSGFSLAPA